VGNKKVKLEFDVERKDKYDHFLAYIYIKHEGKTLVERNYQCFSRCPSLFTVKPQNP